MRLTKEIKEVLITNLLKQSPLGLRSIACMKERRDIVEVIRQLCLSADKTSDDAIREFRDRIESVNNSLGNNFIVARVGCTEVTKEKYHAIEIVFGMGGEVHSLRIDGHDSRWVQGHGRSYLWESAFFGHWLRKDYPLEQDGHFVPFSRVLLPADQKLQARMSKVDAEYNALFDEVISWRATMRSNLARVNTYEQLREQWPEAFPFLPPETKKQTAAVALSPETLNALCGLPK